MMGRLGSKDKNRIENIACQGLWLVLLLTILLTGIIFGNDFWMRVFGQSKRQSLGVSMAAIVFTRRFYYLTKVLKKIPH